MTAIEDVPHFPMFCQQTHWGYSFAKTCIIQTRLQITGEKSLSYGLINC